VVTVQKVDCSVCAALLERRLRTVAGVSSVTVDQKTGRAVVRGSGVSREALRREAEAGGFVVRGVEGVEGG
jgi:copper chaperone CopZ